MIWSLHRDQAFQKGSRFVGSRRYNQQRRGNEGGHGRRVFFFLARKLALFFFSPFVSFFFPSKSKKNENHSRCFSSRGMTPHPSRPLSSHWSISVSLRDWKRGRKDSVEVVPRGRNCKGELALAQKNRRKILCSTP